MCVQCEDGLISFLDISKDEGTQLYCDSPGNCKEMEGFYRVGNSCVKMTCHEFAEYAKDVPSLAAFSAYVYTYNGACLEKCPDDAVFVNADDKCLQKCDNEQYKISERDLNEQKMEVYVCTSCEGVTSGYYTVTQTPAGKLCNNCTNMFKHSNQECNETHCSESEANSIFNNSGVCASSCPLTSFGSEHEVDGIVQYDCITDCKYAYLSKDITKGDVSYADQKVCIEEASGCTLLSNFTKF